MIAPTLIHGISITPDQLWYDGKGVWVDKLFIDSPNPRKSFAELLTIFIDTSEMFVRRGSFIRDNTLYDLRYVDIGFNCVIGGDGFGYIEGYKMPHLGGVEIGDGVSIGNNVCIDRGVIGNTIIGADTKIDNLVHIAHGAKIGKNCLIVAGTVIGGSAIIGDNCFLGINCSIKNKVRIGNNVTVGMGAVVTKDIPDGETWVGNPASRFIKGAKSMEIML